MWRIHRHIGMGGDQVVSALTDEQTDRERGDDIRAAEAELYSELIGEVQPMRGSRELIEHLHGRGHTVVLASSAKQEELDHYLDLLDARELSCEDVAQAYLEYLYTPEAQDIAARNYYRPRDPAVALRYAERYPALNLVTIQDFGGWDTAQAAYFADGGLFDRIYTPGK